MLHSLYYLVPFLVLLGIGWWVYTLQNYPQVRYLPLAEGGGIHAQIEGRDDNLIKYADQSTGQVSIVPIASLARWGRLLAWIMPANTHFSFPMDCTLTDRNGKIIRVHLTGHSNSLVKFILLSNGQYYLYPLENLSPQDQAWIASMPTTDNQTLDATPAAQHSDPVYVQQLEAQLAKAKQDFLDDKARAADPINSGVQREVYLKEAANAKEEVAHIQNELNAISQQENTPKPDATKTAQ
jgi:hypothetical protein